MDKRLVTGNGQFFFITLIEVNSFMMQVQRQFENNWWLKTLFGLTLKTEMVKYFYKISAQPIHSYNIFPLPQICCYSSTYASTTFD